jgi:hypothetical protein
MFFSEFNMHPDLQLKYNATDIKQNILKSDKKTR